MGKDSIILYKSSSVVPQVDLFSEEESEFRALSVPYFPPYLLSFLL